MRKLIPFAAAAALAAAAPAFAQEAPAPAATTGAPAATTVSVSAGQTVYDTAGGEVGKVSRVDAGTAVIATGTKEVGLPLTSFAAGEKGPVIAMTRTQLEAAAAGAAASSAAAVTAGAAVKDTSGGAVGTIKSVDGQYALLDTSAVQVRLPLTAFAAQGDGLVIGMTRAQLEAAASAAKPAAK